MKLQKKTAGFLSVFAAALWLGCMPASATTTEPAQTEDPGIVPYTCISNPEKETCIYVILKNYHGNYWKSVIEGVTDAAEEIDAAVYLGGIDNETDIDGQIALMDQAIDAGADGILLAPANSTSLIESCQRAKKEDLALVLIDSTINSSDYDCCYMTDNMEAGSIAAKEMLSMLKEAGNDPDEALEVGILLSSDTSQAMVNRVSGFLEYWASDAPEQWDIAEDIFLNGGDVKTAQADAAKLLDTHSQLKGLFGCNNTSTIGISSTLLAQERTDIAMVGFDLADETRALIQDPNYPGVSLLQKQNEMAYQGMHALESLINGNASTQKYFDTGVILIDQDYLMEHEVS